MSKLICKLEGFRKDEIPIEPGTSHPHAWYQLFDSRGTYQERVERIVKLVRQHSPVREDSYRLCRLSVSVEDSLLTLDNKGASFVQNCCDFLSQRYGPKNVVDAYYEKHNKTIDNLPCLVFLFVPVYNGRLSFTALFGGTGGFGGQHAFGQGLGMLRNDLCKAIQEEYGVQDLEPEAEYPYTDNDSENADKYLDAFCLFDKEDGMAEPENAAKDEDKGSPGEHWFAEMLSERPMLHNPFTYMHSWADSAEFASALAKLTNSGCGKEDYWEQTCDDLYHALVEYVRCEVPAEKQSMRALAEMLEAMSVHADDKDAQDTVGRMFHALAEKDPDHMAVFYYHQYKRPAGLTAKSVLAACVRQMESLGFLPPFASDMADDNDTDVEETDCSAEPSQSTEKMLIDDLQTIIGSITRKYPEGLNWDKPLPRWEIKVIGTLTKILAGLRDPDNGLGLPKETVENVESLMLFITARASRSQKIISRRDLHALRCLYDSLQTQ